MRPLIRRSRSQSRGSRQKETARGSCSRESSLMICALPLGAIAMSAQFLVRSEALRDAETRAAGRIVSSAGIMAKMVSDLLDFAQVRMGGHLSISPARMSLSERARRQAPPAARWGVNELAVRLRTGSACRRHPSPGCSSPKCRPRCTSLRGYCRRLHADTLLQRTVPCASTASSA